MTSLPFISIIIPTYNRPRRLEKCLQSLTQLTYPQDRYEVVVVDDGSPTPMDTITDAVASEISLRLIRQDNAGPARARNTGAGVAQGDYLAFTDDDCQVEANWLMALAAAVTDHPDTCIGGRTLNALPQNIYSAASQLLVDYLYQYYNREKGTATFFTSNNFAVPRSLFQKLGGFDTSFPLAAGEDREFCDRWLQQGLAMTYAPDMVIHHYHELSLKRFWRQHFNYGRGAYFFHRVKAKRKGGNVKVESLRFYRQLLTYPMAHQAERHQVQLSGLLLLSQAANLAGFFWERSQQPDPSSAISFSVD
jgi:GT2 family glycosyltransferase